MANWPSATHTASCVAYPYSSRVNPLHSGCCIVKVSRDTRGKPLLNAAVMAGFPVYGVWFSAM